MKLPSTMSSGHNFSKVPNAEIPRSSFDRSHGYKTTFDSGFLIPCFVDEALPGDTFNLQMTAFSRMATPLHPIMDNLYLSSFFFAVPYRLLWENWEKFNGAQDNPADSTSFVIPTMTAGAGGYAEASLHDYLGIPPGVEGLEHSSLWHRAYNLIYNEWFRDENLQDSVVVDVDDGPDDPTDYVLLRRGKRHDYFTSALPWPQKGDSVDLPLGTSAPVIGTGGSISVYNANDATVRQLVTDTTPNVTTNTTPAATGQMRFSTAGFGATGLETDLTNATAATINQLRQAFQIQKLYERDARGGTRYTEVVKAHFGVTSPDARLQRPEYLGGGRTPVGFETVPQTSESGTTPQGTLTAFGTAVAQHGFTKSFTEHCILIGMVCVNADLNYQQGLNRMFSRQTRFDFYWPALAHIGEQAVLNKELYAQGTAGGTDDDDVFGYQERFAEYRYKPSQVTAAMRSSAATPLDTWHLAQDFASLPALNAAFIQDNPPVSRVVAVPSEPEFIFDSYFRLNCARPMPIYGVPGLIDHF